MVYMFSGRRMLAQSLSVQMVYMFSGRRMMLSRCSINIKGTVVEFFLALFLFRYEYLALSLLVLGMHDLRDG